jgi:hypothetical protein
VGRLIGLSEIKVVYDKKKEDKLQMGDLFWLRLLFISKNSLSHAFLKDKQYVSTLGTIDEALLTMRDIVTKTGLTPWSQLAVSHIVLLLTEMQHIKTCQDNHTLMSYINCIRTHASILCEP